MERYPSVMNHMKATHGALDEAQATAFVDGIFHRAGTDWVMEGTRSMPVNVGTTSNTIHLG